jgi:hypothetical protein
LIAKLIKAALRAGLWVVLAMGVLVGSAAQETAVRSAEVEGVAYEQPKVHPGEFSGDLSRLPRAPTTIGATKVYRPRLQGPPLTKFVPQPSAPSAPEQIGGPSAPMPGTIENFAGLSFNDLCTGGQCGAGWPPDPNGDVGPNHYIEAVNDSIAIYGKSGALLASFTEDNLWNGVGTTPCNGNAQGDPVVVYDWLADRFVITWFAFPIVSGKPASPFYQCIAASKTSDPVAGGWRLYAVRTDPGGTGQPLVGDLNDYGKFGLWHDCLYMGANLFRFNASHNGTYDGVLFGSFSRADLYNGSPLTFSLGRLPTTSNAFTLVPSNNQGTGVSAAQPGTPNYFVSESGTAFAFEVRTFTAGANCGAGGTLSTATNVSHAAYTSQQGAVVPQPNTTHKLDMIDDRIMQKVPYRKIGSAESLWVTHPVGTAAGTTAMQWAQLDVTGGTIAAAPVQQQIYAPDATLYRFMGSLAVDTHGNMALGYSTSNGTVPNYPSIAYSGRLATDPLNTLPQTEVQMIAGSGSQTNNCGGAPCDRWGDYSAMSLDPADGCTFWYVNEYYSSQTNGNAGNWQTRIGSFRLSSCASPLPTTTMLVSSLNPATVGATVTFTATVTGSNPTGTVNFTDGGSSIAGCAAVALSGAGNSKTAACSTSSLAVGTHSIIASYGGDANNAGSSSAALSQVINASAGSMNVALASNGGIASASSTYSTGYPASAVNNDERAGLNAGNGGYWNDATPNTFPDWVQINFNGSKSIDHVVVYSVQDNYTNPVEPTDTMSFSLYGLVDFTVQGWDGANWVTLATVSGNNLIKRTATFSSYTTDRIRINVSNALNTWSRITEVEAWTVGG